MIKKLLTWLFGKGERPRMKLESPVMDRVTSPTTETLSRVERDDQRMAVVNKLLDAARRDLDFAALRKQGERSDVEPS